MTICRFILCLNVSLCLPQNLDLLFHRNILFKRGKEIKDLKNEQYVKEINTCFNNTK